ncbi:hypothetical protein [Sphingomonas sp. TDK1]|uniref:hypothetical protein n=1 Tax=Sphingomonas sp. TDK1 TaxID=453247 RepID=UPI0007D969B9|nr:hypothetical protein [Sphingomonas sp. TDK1]OAN63859.1 hypothetical protein A7X12_18775 [Sphingomonas sp. TDK1]
MGHGSMNPAQRRYSWRFGGAMGAYSVVLIACKLAARAWHPEGVSLFLLALAPALPLLAAIAAYGLYLLEEKDEFLRNINATAALGGLGVVLAFCTVWGFLTDGGLVPGFPLWGTFPLWALGMGLSQGVLWHRYRNAGADA